MVSVIVPVLDVEAYLEKCIDSVLPALGEGDELILCLGNSRDGSNDICHTYAAREQAVREVVQNGKGLSNARNCAIQAARGDYILCIDSDDFVKTDTLKALLARMRAEDWTEDVIVTDYYRLDRRTGRQSAFFQIGDIPDVRDMAFLKTMLSRRQCFWNVWRYLYRREFLLENAISFPENSLSEDIAYTTRVLLRAKRICFTHSPYYVYTVGRGDSLMDCPTWKRLSDTVNILSDAIAQLRASEDANTRCMLAQFQFELLLNMAQLYEIPSQDRPQALELYTQRVGLLSPSEDALVRTAAGAVRVLGISCVARGLHHLKMIRRWWRGRKKISES